MRTLYNLLLLAGVMLGFPVLLPWIILWEKRRRTAFNRLGWAPVTRLSRPAAFRRPPIWVHALSVGEVLSAVPLVRAVKAACPEVPLVFSASTQTGHETARKALTGLVDALAWFPYDLPLTVKLVARRIDPALVLVVESDLWPNFLAEMERRRTPLFLINARLSERSFAGFRRFPAVARTIFTPFTRICTQTAEDAGRFRRLGAAGDKVVVTGNLKFDQVTSRQEPAVLERLRTDLGIRPEQQIVVAGSTHPGEEEILAAAYRELKRRFPDLLFIVAPRDHRRGAEVARIFQAVGGRPVMFTARGKARPTPGGPDVVVVDVIGRLRQLYALADAAFVGGSLLPYGGHNPLEPAVFGKPVLFGPHMNDFAQIAGLLLEGEGALRVNGAGEICRVMGALLADPSRAEAMGGRAAAVFHAHQGAVARTLAVIREAVRAIQAPGTA